MPPFRPPRSVRREARRALDWRKDLPPSRRAMTPTGVRRAVQLANGQSVSTETIRRMLSFFDRHEVDKEAEGFRPGEDGYPSKGRQAWAGWGGDAGRAWARKIARKYDREWYLARLGRRRKARADQRRQSTRAPRRDRIRGSRKNKPGSATAKGRTSIELSDKTRKALSRKVEEHNEKHGDNKGKRATLSKLAAVYRRGSGAFSVSHRPGVSRGAWSMARVNAFLYLLRNGRPKDSRYKGDNDLLPKGHPRAKKETG